MMPITKADAERIVSQTGWLSIQPEYFRNEVLRRAVLVHFAAGEIVYYFGDPLGGIYGIVTGMIAVNTSPPYAVPRLIHLGTPGTWTGEGCFISRQPRRIELRAVVDTWMMHLPLDAMDQMAARDPNVARYIAQILMINVDLLLRVIHDLQQPEATRRIAAILWRVSPDERPIPMSQVEIGIMANASRKQVNAALQHFETLGWVSNAYRSIVVKDIKAMREFAAGDGTD